LERSVGNCEKKEYKAGKDAHYEKKRYDQRTEKKRGAERGAAGICGNDGGDGIGNRRDMDADGGVCGDMTAPCKDCAKRSPACHSRCEAYRAFRAWKDAQNRKVQQTKELRETKILLIQNTNKRLRNHERR